MVAKKDQYTGMLVHGNPCHGDTRAVVSGVAEEKPDEPLYIKVLHRCLEVSDTVNDIFLASSVLFPDASILFSERGIAWRNSAHSHDGNMGTMLFQMGKKVLCGRFT